MASLHRIPNARAPARRRRCRRAVVASASLIAAAWGTLGLAQTFVSPPRVPVKSNAAGLLLGAGVGAFTVEGVAFAEDAAGSFEGMVIGGVDVVKLAYDLFFAGIIIALLKNNLIDYNGPLSGVLGMATPTARVSHILVNDEKACKEILAELTRNGEPPAEAFSAVALVSSTCGSAKTGGSLGIIYKDTMAKEFDAVCFDNSKALNVIHGPVKTEFGYHLIRVSERWEGAPPPEEAEKEDQTEKATTA